ncbi:hypothetical protein GAX98_09955 [Phocaeicola vulgatus]|uniref:Uncharacterized protein n=1 Tax=Bacteroides uniformis TaxID=820 RepID=A0A6I0JNH4_BACUN|nr:hypothetical protein GAS34_06435 [Bacteroides uniformis]KAB6572383.1 hypothetical protein GAY81_02040 [Phocaeicola vulgatus]KAB3895541.1 hypothetical protein GAS04_07730 [Bacteroides uniformis]KAB3898053.1 hypothetical protein GAS12_06830 [Bacteroides uniformis]KAB3900557.1 hypothetical protein GAS03_05515 [Bacteroides uniformis]
MILCEYLFFPFHRFLFVETVLEFYNATHSYRYSFMRRLFLPITLRRRKNLQEIHFKLAASSAIADFCIRKTQPVPT